MAGYDGYLFQGVPFRGEFSATDSSTQVLTTEASHRFALYPPGSTTALSVGASDTVIITDLCLHASAASKYYIYDGSDINADAGDILFTVRIGTGGPTVVSNLGTPVVCQAGTYPKVIGSSTVADVNAVITGVIKRSV